MGNARNIAFWVVLFLLILALFNAFGGNQSTTASRTVSYSEFIQRVDAGEVASATIDGERVVATDTTGNRFATVAPNDPKLTERLIDKGVEVRAEGDLLTVPGTVPAGPEDFGREFLDMIIAARIVDGVDGAIAHIRRYGSQHTESILTENDATAARFFERLDSAILMRNASTQFADGGEFGMGGEIGIATGKMHARGPVGVEQLTSFKYRVRGNGQVRP